VFLYGNGTYKKNEAQVQNRFEKPVLRLRKTGFLNWFEWFVLACVWFFNE